MSSKRHSIRSRQRADLGRLLAVGIAAAIMVGAARGVTAQDAPDPAPAAEAPAPAPTPEQAPAPSTSSRPSVDVSADAAVDFPGDI